MDVPRELLARVRPGGGTAFALIESVGSDGTVTIVAEPGSPAQKARTIVDVGLADAGREAVIMIDPNQPDAPVILRTGRIAALSKPLSIESMRAAWTGWAQSILVQFGSNWCEFAVIVYKQAAEKKGRFCLRPHSTKAIDNS